MGNKSGFSTLEMVVVIAIIAVVAAFSSPNFFSWMPAKRLQSAASDVQSALQMARLEAVKQNTNAVVAFNLADESYTITVGGGTIRSRQLPAGVDLKAVYQAGTTTDVTPCEVRFDSRGLPNPAIEVRLENTANTEWTIRLSLSGSSRIEKG
jgi:type IV fimbrial biogenesis protein FimT